MVYSGIARIGHLVVCLVGMVLLGIGTAQAQTPVNNKPPKPILKYLEVQPSGNIIVNWEWAQKHRDYTEPIGVYVLRQDADGNWVDVSGKQPGSYDLAPEGEWTDIDADPKTGPVSYKLVSFDNQDNKSDETNVHTTIHLTATYDECKREIRVTWTLYMGIAASNIVAYDVYRSFGNAIAATDKILSKPREEDPLYVEKEVLYAKEYNYQVKLVTGDKLGNEHLSSNSVMVRTAAQRIVGELRVDSVISFPDRNRLRIFIDPQSRMDHYELIRRDDLDLGPSQWTVLETLKYDALAGPPPTEYEDNSRPSDIQGRVRYYHIRAVDMCGEGEDSPPLNSTVLRVANHEEENRLEWSQMVKSEDINAVEYNIYRQLGSDSLKRWELIHSSVGEQNKTYTDDVSMFKGDNYSARFCYYIDAWELKGGQRARRSRSHVACANKKPVILLPNAIAPLDKGKPTQTGWGRHQFAPRVTMDTHFRLHIYDRTGRTIFTGEDQPWLGTMPNGSLAPEGAYIYRCEVWAEGSKPVVEMGSVMVVYPVRK